MLTPNKLFPAFPMDGEELSRTFFEAIPEDAVKLSDRGYLMDLTDLIILAYKGNKINPYHNMSHSQVVSLNLLNIFSIEFNAMLNMSLVTVALLAGMFHDFNHSGDKTVKDEVNIAVALQGFLKFVESNESLLKNLLDTRKVKRVSSLVHLPAYSLGLIVNTVKEMIKATRYESPVLGGAGFMHTPTNFFEEAIRDADLMCNNTVHTPSLRANLSVELGVPFDATYIKGTFEFLTTAKYFTKTGWWVQSNSLVSERSQMESLLDLT